MTIEKATTDGSAQLLRNGAEVFPAWLAAIAAAREEIVLEMYWFDSDRTGRQFAAALIERARAGVEVFVIYDAIGSLGSDDAMYAGMEAAGIKVREFNPILPWRARFRFAAVGLRDHRKILVVDETVAFTGGINLCDQAASKESGGGGWRDDAVRVVGRPVSELRALFFDTWLRLGGPVPARGPVSRRARRQLNAAARYEAGQSRSSWRDSLSRLALPVRARASRAASITLAQRPTVQVLGHNTWTAQRTIRNLYVRQIRGARERILIANSYFVPDNTVHRALERAARRGVEVRVIVPEHSDVPSVGWAARAMFTRLMRAGVHVHLWLEGMMHAKSAVIDGWATVGSYNLDYRSLRYNLEVNVASEEPAFVGSVA
ncbi:MAG: phospholipase D-like domain-containing protein, partial [Deltaproteobacteria bacterium]